MSKPSRAILCAAFCALFVTTALTGCGNETSADGAPDPCKVLDVATINQATGWTLPAGARPKEEVDVGWTSCSWFSDDADGARGVVLRVMVGGQAEFDKLRAEISTRITGDTDLDLSGSEDAFEVPDHGLLTVRTKQFVAQMSVIGGDVPASAHRDLADDLLAGLERS